MPRKLTISLDAMGGDQAPEAVIKGAEMALVRHPDLHFLLIGPEDRIRSLMSDSPHLLEASTLLHTDVAVAMNDKPSQALRKGRRTSSMWLAIEAVRDGRADIAVSGGNTGALMAMAKVLLHTLPGIERPAIAAFWPTMRGESVVLDMGANVEANAKQLVDFAVMGEVFARVMMGIERPSLGLLNIGIEEIKGRDEVKEAAQLLSIAKLNAEFCGFVEGDDLGKGTVDVVVSDGFTGNIALKAAEGTALLVANYLDRAIRRSLLARIGYSFAYGAFKAVRQKMDPRRVNGGVLLGLNGIVVKSHGGTDALGYASAIDVAVDVASHDVAAQIAAELELAGPLHVPHNTHESAAEPSDDNLNETRAVIS